MATTLDARSRTAPFARLSLFALLLGGSAALVACGGGKGGGASSSGGGDDTAPKLQGEYTATAAGPIAEIIFYGESQYYLQTNDDCGTQTTPCAKAGTYAVDSAESTLSLTDSTSGATQVMSLSILTTAEVPADFNVGDDLAPQGICVRSPTGVCCNNVPDDPSCATPAAADTDAGSSGGALVTAAPTPLVSAPTTIVQCTGNCTLTFSANGQPLSMTGGSMTLVTPAH